MQMLLDNLKVYCNEWNISVQIANTKVMFSNITKRCLYKFDSLKPHFYIKLGLTGVYIIFLIFAQKHR